MVVTTNLDDSSLEFYWRLTVIGIVMIVINMSYAFYEYKEYDQDSSWGMKILFNTYEMRFAGFFLGGLLMLPAILSFGVVALILYGAIYILWILIKYITNRGKIK